jgi:hypothetical protein
LLQCFSMATSRSVLTTKSLISSISGIINGYASCAAKRWLAAYSRERLIVHQDSDQDTALSMIHGMDVEEPPSQEVHALAGARSNSLLQTSEHSLAEPRALRPFTCLYGLGHHCAAGAQRRTTSSGTFTQPSLLRHWKAVLEAAARRHEGNAVDNAGGHVARPSSPQTAILTPAHSITILRELHSVVASGRKTTLDASGCAGGSSQAFASAQRRDSLLAPSVSCATPAGPPVGRKKLAHATHSGPTRKSEGEHHTKKACDAKQPKGLQRQNTHTQAPRDTHACQHHPSTL